MNRFLGTTLLLCVAFGACAFDANQAEPKPSGQKDSAACPKSDLAPREVSREGVEYLQRLRKNTPFGTNSFDLAGLRAGMGSRRQPNGKDIKFIRVKIGDIPCEWVLAPGADPDLRLLYIHGGGFVSGSGGFYLTLAAHISAAAKCAVLLPDYRLAPEHRFPAGLEDCIRAHEWMMANGPTGPAPAQATFVAGDSAGGSLTLATLLALRDRRKPLPRGGIALSPTTDLALASESLKTVHDPIISAKTMPVFRDHYLGKTDPRDPLASPVFGDYRGMPPLLIQVGEHEMLRDDSVRAAAKARADGAQVKLEVWPGMFHVFQSHEPLLPEAKEAINHIADFMRASLPAHGATPGIPMAIFKNYKDIKWDKILPDLGESSPEICILHVDPPSKATKLLIRTPKGIHIRKHWHSANETHTVILGTPEFACDGKRIAQEPGSFNFLPAKMVYEAWVPAGALVFITVDGPWDVNWVEGPPTAADLIK